MGFGAVNVAVVDAGPLIHLTEIGCLSLLRIFDILHIPDAVWSETVGQGRAPQDDVLGLNWGMERIGPLEHTGGTQGHGVLSNPT